MYEHIVEGVCYTDQPGLDNDLGSVFLVAYIEGGTQDRDRDIVCIYFKRFFLIGRYFEKGLALQVYGALFFKICRIADIGSFVKGNERSVRQGVSQRDCCAGELPVGGVTFYEIDNSCNGSQQEDSCCYFCPDGKIIPSRNLFYGLELCRLVDSLPELLPGGVCLFVGGI